VSGKHCREPTNAWAFDGYGRDADCSAIAVFTALTARQHSIRIITMALAVLLLSERT